MSVTTAVMTLAVVFVLGSCHQAHSVQAASSVPADFKPAARTNVGTIRLAGPMDTVFPLFGPVQEKKWAPGWNPRVLAPAGAEVAEGMVFLVEEDPGTVYWVVTRYEPSQHAIAYANVLPGSTLNRIEIQCHAAGNETECSVRYSYVGLSEKGNRYVESQSDEHYAAKMAHWTEAINHYLKTGKTIEGGHH